MSEIEVICPKCGTGFILGEEFIEQKVRCSKCSAKFVIFADGSTSAPFPKDGGMADWAVGDTILDLYEVTGILGEGGMGRVYRVHHKTWNVDLAVKSLKLEMFSDAGAVADFERECETWINLGLHPHIVSCYYVREIGGIARIFAECVEGGNLGEWIRDGRLYEGGPKKSLGRILDIAIQFAWGLGYAHEKGLIHQDVKPGNLMVASDGTAKVTDFGLAKARIATGITHFALEQSILLTSGGMTPAYCSPEQARGEKLSRRTDIWSWGVSVLEMFCGGVSWYSGTLAPEALDQLIDQGCDDERIPELPEPLGDLLFSCFQRDPNARPGNFLEIFPLIIETWEMVIGTRYPRIRLEASNLTAASLNNHAVSLVDLNQGDKALETWEKALELDSNHPDSVYNRGINLWKSGKVDDRSIISQMKAVCLSRPNDWKGRYLMGLVHLERGDIFGAINEFELAAKAGSRREVDEALREAEQLTSRSAKCLRIVDGDALVFPDSVALSSDGGFALTPWKENLKLWDVKSGECLRVFEGDSSAVCFSSDGRFALASAVGYNLRLWQVITGKCLRTFEGHSGSISSVCMSGDDRIALSGSWDQTARLWNVNTGQCLRIFEGHTKWVTSVSLSADGRLAISGGLDDTVRVWDVNTGRCLRVIEAATNSVCLGADGRFALFGRRWMDKNFYLYDVRTGHRKRTFEGHTASVKSVCLSIDGRFALSGSEDLTVRLWNVNTGQCLRIFEGHERAVSSVCMNADGSLAVSAGAWGNIRFWNLELLTSRDSNKKCQFVLSDLITAEAAQVAATKCNELIELAESALLKKDWNETLKYINSARVFTGLERAPKIVELSAKAGRYSFRSGFYSHWLCRTFEGNSNSSACFSSDGCFAFSGCDGTIRMWEVNTGRCLRTFEGHTASVDSVCLSADGRFALSCGWDHVFEGNDKTILREKTFRLWNVTTSDCVRTFSGLHSGCLSPDGRFVLSNNLGDDGGLQLWDTGTGKCVRIFEGIETGQGSILTSFSSDGRFALSWGGDRTLRLWDLTSGQCMRTFEENSDMVIAVCWSADGRFALSGGWDKFVSLWDVGTGHCVRKFDGHSKSVESVCFSVDGRFALSGSKDSTVRLWNVNTGQCLRILEGHTGTVNSVCFSPNGRFALSSAETLRLWELDWEYEYRAPVNWNEGARPYLQNFLTLHTPFLTNLPSTREPTRDEITLFLTRKGRPIWTEDDFDQLIFTLACAGYGWLGKEGVRRELECKAEEANFAETRFVSLIEEGEFQASLGKWDSVLECVKEARGISGYRGDPRVVELAAKAGKYCKLKGFYDARFNGVLQGHTDEVISMCLSRDGFRAFSSGRDKTLRLWDVKTGKCLQTFEGPIKDQISEEEELWDENERIGYLVGDYKIWKRDKGIRDGDEVIAVCLSADGITGLTGREDGLIHFWNVTTGECLRTFDEPSDPVESVCLSPDGRWALGGRYLELYDVNTGKDLRMLGYGYDCSGCFSADGRFAVGSWDGGGDKTPTLGLWEVSTGRCLRIFEGHTMGINSVCLSEDGRFVLSGSQDGTCRLWDLGTGRCLMIFEGHTKGVTSVVMSIDGRWCVSGSADETIRLWEASSGSCQRIFEGIKDGAEVCLSSDCRLILSKGGSHDLRMWELDWEYEYRAPQEWDEGARVYLQNFLTIHTPYKAELPATHEPTEEEITLALSRKGRPTWRETDFDRFMDTLAYAGYGWLRKEGVRSELEKMSKNWHGPPPLPN